jgi:hypothetical protein
MAVNHITLTYCNTQQVAHREDTPSHQYVCLYVYPPIAARQQLGETVTVATNTDAIMKNCWVRRILCRPYRIKGKQAISSSQNLLF